MRYTHGQTVEYYWLNETGLVKKNGVFLNCNPDTEKCLIKCEHHTVDTVPLRKIIGLIKFDYTFKVDNASGPLGDLVRKVASFDICKQVSRGTCKRVAHMIKEGQIRAINEKNDSDVVMNKWVKL